ncbi:MAG: hypothetical protein A2096_15570 [Spirochaetes bacterium GWF1_41_5]|nr:MAG: hypothetical protein A2096_15570 [Spirochaetes bacterium GWF1_41_5]HBE04837.1 hypothetical protein [Spirochaetia bacterium]
MKISPRLFYPYQIPVAAEAKKRWSQIIIEKDKVYTFSRQDQDLGIYACYARYEQLPGLPLHFHRFFEITLLLSGAGTNFIGKWEYPMRAGSLFFINHLEEHREVITSPTVEKLILAFLPQVIESGLTLETSSALLGSFLLSEPFCRDALASFKGYLLSGAALQRVSRSWLQLIHTFYQKSDRYKSFLIKNHLISLLSVILEESILRSPLPKRTSDTLTPCINYLHTHYMMIKDINDIIPLSMISRGHFYKLFKKNTGMHPSQYLNNLRVQKAKELLRKTTLSVKNITREVGFANESYFHRLFKSITGTSPVQYRYGGSTEAKIVQ